MERSAKIKLPFQAVAMLMQVLYVSAEFSFQTVNRMVVILRYFQSATAIELGLF